MKIHYGILAIGVTASAVLACQADEPDARASAPADPRLSLSEAGAVPLPSDFFPQGVHVSPTGDVLVWDAGGRLMHYDIRAETRRIDSVPKVGSGLIGAAITSTAPFTIQVFQTGPPVIRALEWPRGDGGGVRASRTVSDSLLTVADLGEAVGIAQYRHGTWHFLRQRDTQASLAALRPGRATETLTRIPPTFSHLPWLGPAGEGFLVTDRRRPFESVAIADGGEVLSTFRPLELEGLDDELARGPPANWVSLGLVDFGDGFLQTIADRRSDRRIVVVFSSDGRPLRYQALEVPFGIAAALAGSSGSGHDRILAVRGGRDRELVIYEWSWT